MSPEINMAPKPEERIVNTINKAIPLLKEEVINSPWLVALMPIVTDKRTGNELYLSSNRKWIFYTRTDMYWYPTHEVELNEILLKYARVTDRSSNLKYEIKDNEDYTDFLVRLMGEESRYLGKNKKKLMSHFINSLESSAQNLSKQTFSFCHKKNYSKLSKF